MHVEDVAEDGEVLGIREEARGCGEVVGAVAGEGYEVDGDDGRVVWVGGLVRWLVGHFWCGRVCFRRVGVNVDVGVGLMEVDCQRRGSDGSCAFVIFLHAEKMEGAKAWKLLLLADEAGLFNPFLPFHEHSLTRCR